MHMQGLDLLEASYGYTAAHIDAPLAISGGMLCLMRLAAAGVLLDSSSLSNTSELKKVGCGVSSRGEVGSGVLAASTAV